MPFSFSAAWLALPVALRAALVRDSAGKAQRLRWGLHLLDTLSALPPTERAARLRLACDLLLAAWEADPGDLALAAQLLRLHQSAPCLPSPVAAHLTVLERMPLPPDAAPRSQWPAPLHFMAHWRAGLHAWSIQDWENALAHFQEVDAMWLTPLELAGHCLYRLGRKEEAFAHWRRVLTARPWHANLALTLHDKLQGWDTPLPTPAGATAVLLYSWNKSGDLHATLEALTDSAADIALIACLDNGSTDATGDVLSAWEERLGKELFLPVRLPVNVGAPAARNWLMQLPEVRRLPFAAYLDDDALAPADWLRHLGRAVSCCPSASAWGCRIVEAQPPYPTQSGPLHLEANFLSEDPTVNFAGGDETPEVAFSPLRAHGEPFSIANPSAEADPAHWEMLRPCASVTGCCHLFRTEKLLARGGFSLSLSPSQYDDLEHDLRAVSHGELACCTGFCAVRHAKRTGQGVQMSGAAFGNGQGNKYKVHGLHDAASVAAMIRRETALREAYLLARLEVLDGLC